MRQIWNVLKMMKNLYYLGKIRITDAGPETLGVPVMIIPRVLYTRLIEVYANNPAMELQIYNVMKHTTQEYSDELGASQDMEIAEMLETLFSVANIYGYGRIEISDYDRDTPMAAFFIRHLPSDEANPDQPFKGDTYWAGMLAGGLSYIFDQDVECLETQCKLEGHNSCRFVVAPRNVLKKEYPECYKQKFENPACLLGEQQ